MDRKILAIGGTALVIVLAVGLVSQANKIDITSGQLAVINLNGPISAGQSTGAFSSSSGISPGQVRELNQKAKNRGADAILYEINSGGGAVVASKEVKREIESVDVPTVCRFRDIGASGAYLFALGCDRIVADSSTLTGSIGVRSSYFEFSGTLNKLGIEYVNITAGERKDLGSPYRNITEEEQDILQQKADRVHQEFIRLVESERNLTRSELNTATTGEPFLGDRARELSLVDTVGGRQTAINEAENLTDMKLSTMEIQQRPSFNILNLLAADSFVGNFLGNQGSPIQASYRH